MRQISLHMRAFYDTHFAHPKVLTTGTRTTGTRDGQWEHPAWRSFRKTDHSFYWNYKERQSQTHQNIRYNVRL